MAAFQDVLEDCLPNAVLGRLLGHPAKDLGDISILKAWIIASIEPCVSKLWWCRDRFLVDGGMEELDSGLYGPKLRIGDLERWSAPVREDGEAWLELKGRFLGSPRWDQKKLILGRAKGLHRYGTA